MEERWLVKPRVEGSNPFLSAIKGDFLLSRYSIIGNTLDL